LAPFGLEISQGLLGLDVIGGLINPFEILGDVLAILPAAEVQRMAHQMHDARLDSRVGKGRVDGVREALEAINDGDQDVFDAPVAQIVHHREPELGPLIIGDPQPQNLAFTFRSDAQSDVNRLVFNLSAFRIANFDAQGIKKNDGVHRLQSAVLPVRHLLQDGIGDATDKVG